MFSSRELPAEVGILGIVLWVWYWDWKHETITSFFWRYPKLSAFVWGWLFSHMVFKRPRKVLVKW